MSAFSFDFGSDEPAPPAAPKPPSAEELLAALKACLSPRAATAGEGTVVPPAEAARPSPALETERRADGAVPPAPAARPPEALAVQAPPAGLGESETAAILPGPAPQPRRGGRAKDPLKLRREALRAAAKAVWGDPQQAAFRLEQAMARDGFWPTLETLAARPAAFGRLKGADTASLGEPMRALAEALGLDTIRPAPKTMPLFNE